MLIDEHEAAEFLNVPVTRLRMDRHRKQGAPFIKLGRTVRYDTDDLRRFICDCRIMPENNSDTFAREENE